MQFIQSFYSLGYSAINVALVWLMIVAIGYRVLGFQKRGRIAKALYFAVLFVFLVLATNFLAEQNRLLNDAIRQEGGLIRTETK